MATKPKKAQTSVARHSSGETYARAVEFEPSVTITDQTFFAHGWQPTTIAVLQAIWFLPQGMGFTVEELASWFGELGWKSVNGRPFGIEGVRRELALIRKGGYITAVRLRGAGGKVAGIRYEVSKRARADAQPAGRWIPIQGPDEEITRSHHVPLPTQHGGQPETRETPSSDHVPLAAEHGRPPSLVGSPFPQVAPCAVGKPHPPHPPEEVTTSSPYPLVDASGLEPAAPGEEEGRVFDPEETAAAARFLQLLPQPWSIGRLKAKALAVPLLEAMADQGWPQLAELTDRTRRLLVEQLTKNPVGVKNYSSLLERDRVPNLTLFETVAGIPAQSEPSRSQQLPQEDPDFKPVPAPAKVADLLAALRKPSI